MGKRRSPGPGPGPLIFKKRSLHLPNVIVREAEDVVALQDYLDNLVSCLHRLRFSIQTFNQDLIVQQYVVLKFDLYSDTLSHLHGWCRDRAGERVKQKARIYWLVINFIGYQFR